MTYEFNHVHLKAPNPRKTAEWYVAAFNFSIVSDVVRPYGDQFVVTKTVDGITVNISGARTAEELDKGNADAMSTGDLSTSALRSTIWTRRSSDFRAWAQSSKKAR